jgi:polyhydroxyalkanoate synthesis repressor PhaR
MAILIKRYANRKLYNTETSRYITLKGIAKLLEEGEEVRVIDKETGEDITQVALSQILVDNKRAKEDPSDTLLTQILSRGGDALYGAIKKSVDEATDGLGDFQDRFRSFVNQSDPSGRGARGFAWDGRKDGDRRSPFTPSSAPSSASSSAPSSDSSESPHDASPDRENGTAEDTSARGGWPGMGGLPDFRETIRSAVANELDALDLPRTGDLEALNTKLSQVVDAVERLESILADRETNKD